MKSVSLSRLAHHVWQGKGWISTALLPLSWVAHLSFLLKRRRYRRLHDTAHSRVAKDTSEPARSGAPSQPGRSLPIIVVGNIVVGGTGKTPVVIALTRSLLAKGWKPGIISRGYGVQVGAVPRVGQGILEASQFGDEPALIACETDAPIAVHPRRTAAMMALRTHHPEVDIIISDDGLQHLALPRDIEILVQDSRGIGNGRMLPAGPLREPAKKLQEVDYVVTNLAPGESSPAYSKTSPARYVIMQMCPTRVQHLTSETELPWLDWLKLYTSRRIDAIAGIGQPKRFFSMLTNQGLTLNLALGLPDHDDYAESPFLDSEADIILITAKDAVKCQRFADDRVWVVHAEPQFSPADWMDSLAIDLKKKFSSGITL